MTRTPVVSLPPGWSAAEIRRRIDEDPYSARADVFREWVKLIEDGQYHEALRHMRSTGVLDDSDDEGPPPELEIISARELVRRVAAMPAPRYLVRGVWPADAYGVLAAEWKAGKTWADLDLAVSVASGTAWLGTHVIDRPGPVLLFLGEGGARKMERRLRAICEARSVNLDLLPLRLCFRVPHLSDRYHLAEIDAELAATPAVLVIVDPLYLAARGAQAGQLYEMGAHLEAIQHVCQQAGCALVVVTHWNRGDGNGSKRITGAGPAEWGRVLMNLRSVSKATDRETRASTVILELSIEGDEVPDLEMRLRRRVWADDPDDLASPLHYDVEVLDDATSADDSALRPAAQRVLGILDAATDWLTVRQIGDRLAVSGHPLKGRTIQTSLQELRAADLAVSFGADGKAHSWRFARAAEAEHRAS